MKRAAFILLLIFNLNLLFANYSYDRAEDIRKFYYSTDISSLNIPDSENPTIDDWTLIQNFMEEKKNMLENISISQTPFNAAMLKWAMIRMRFSFNDDKREMPISTIDYLGNDPNKKDKCIICYASFPRKDKYNINNYSKGIKALISALKKNNFDGHFFYKIGGWPSLKKGRLKYADVPVSFKPFLFEEARDMGYKNILWLDSITIPKINLDSIFRHIENKGVICPKLGKMTRDYYKNYSMGYMDLVPQYNLSKKIIYDHLTTQMLGINTKHPNGEKVLNELINLAENKISFILGIDYPFSFLMYKYQLTDCAISKNEYKKFFIHDYNIILK